MHGSGRVVVGQEQNHANRWDFNTGEVEEAGRPEQQASEAYQPRDVVLCSEVRRL